MNRFLKSLIGPKAWVALVLLIVLLAAASVLGITGYIQPAIEFLDSERFSLHIGNVRFSAYTLIKGLLIILVIFWIARLVSEFGRKKIRGLSKIKAANRAIIAKSYQVIVYFVALMAALELLGIDFTGLTIFSGAVGIGVGFGLQKITSNFISGLIMLFEKSVEEGDLIELNDGLAGFVVETGARYTLVETFEGHEVMVPNEDFITNRVTNWTFNNTRGRISIDVGVSYDSDINLAYDLMLEAATEHPRTSDDPAPECFLVNYGESSVDFSLYFWVDDIIEGRKRPRSDVLFSIWEKFKQHGIKIPFPQRDIHMIDQAKNHE